MTASNKPTPATLETINSDLAAARVKPIQVCSALLSVAASDARAFEMALESLDTATPEGLMMLFRTHQLSSALASRLPENLNWAGDRAVENYVAANHSAMAQSARDALAKALAPLPAVRKTLIEKISELTTRATNRLGFERAEILEDRDAAEQRQEYLTDLVQTTETAIQYFADNSATVNWPPVVSTIAQLRAELAAAK